MTDAPPKKRPWFQLHLSTCVVLMVVAGALMWANLDWKYFGGNMSSSEYLRGWPKYMQGKSVPAVPKFRMDDHEWPFQYNADMNLEGVAFNLFVALTILGATALACEFPIRRRERKRLEIRP